ncbi:MAG: dihydrodipicolinate synthase family protein, partial [bacterium]|nr:dihydrodipicolinate synthase family protein [bacterium]
MQWAGVMPAITTPFTEDLNIDHDFVKKHVSWLVEHGSTGIVPCGSLGEGATLSIEEKLDLVESCVAGVDGRIPVMPGVAAASTADACRLARGAAERGAGALMVLPPYVHAGSWRETEAHFSSVL